MEVEKVAGGYVVKITLRILMNKKTEWYRRNNDNNKTGIFTFLAMFIF